MRSPPMRWRRDGREMRSSGSGSTASRSSRAEDFGFGHRSGQNPERSSVGKRRPKERARGPGRLHPIERRTDAVLRGVASVDPLVERTTLARMAGLEESTAYVDEHGIPEETWPGGVRSGSPKSPAGRCRGSRRSNGRGACSGSLVHLYVHAVVVAAPPGVRSGGLFDRGCLRCRRARCSRISTAMSTRTASRRRTIRWRSRSGSPNSPAASARPIREGRSR